MAGSRRESIGNILQRLQGLLRSGALKEEDRPIWYDVVKVFPPRPTPPPKPVQKILYPEDFVRVHFNRTYFDNEVMKLTDEKSKTTPERFVDTYMEIQRQNLCPPSEVFEKTASTLKEEGFKIVTHQEKVKVDKERGRRFQSERDADLLPRAEEITVDVNELFSDKT